MTSDNNHGHRRSAGIVHKMKKTHHTLATVTAVAAAALLLTSCAGSNEPVAGEECVPEHEFSTLQDGELTVAVVPVPHLIDLEDGKLTGIEGDILEGFASAECLSIVPQEIGGAGIIPAVQSGRVDMATGGWTPTPERLEIINFSDTTFHDSFGILSREGFASFDELLDADATVGSPQGNKWIDDADAVLGGAHNIYQSFDEAYKDLAAGRLDAVLTGASASLAFMSSDESEGIEFLAAEPDDRVQMTTDPFMAGFPLVKDNADLKAALNDFIQQQRENGDLEETLVKWGMPPESAYPDEG